ncbi:Conserved protein of unknown function [Mycobacterium canettii CIPT 140070010]|nr:Conserved protein of unknown function [Mycobacterium canettii CIPT 140070010]
MGGPFDADAEAHFDEVAEAFAKLTDVDGDVGVDLEKGRVELCMTVEADNRSDALVKAFVAARTAVHTAGGATGTWDNWLPKLLESDSYRSSVTPSSLTRGDCPA